MSEFELRHGEKKKSLKFEIQLVDEADQLEKIDDQVDAMDDAELDDVELQMDEFGVGKRKTLGAKSSVVDRKKSTNSQTRQGTIYG